MKNLRPSIDLTKHEHYRKSRSRNRLNGFGFAPYHRSDRGDFRAGYYHGSGL